MQSRPPSTPLRRFTSWSSWLGACDVGRNRPVAAGLDPCLPGPLAVRARNPVPGIADCPLGQSVWAHAPFRHGEELPLHGSLPLGISPDTLYEDLVFRLHEAETLTLYADGVVEARNAARELFGFERVQRLARERKSAEQIVKAACAFGQEDDITVLSIRRLAAAEEPAKARVNLTAQIVTV
jgi:hypothetical protein